MEGQEVSSAEDFAADFIYGKQPEESGQAPVVEGDEPEEVEAEAEEGEDGEEGEESNEPEFVDVEYEGKLYEVPAELKDALLRQSDYTVKTQSVSAKQKEYETLHAQVEQRAKQYEFAQSVQGDILKAQQLEQTAIQYREYLNQNLDSMSSVDIERVRLAIEDARTERDKLIQGVQAKEKEFQQAQEQSFQELLKKGTEVLRSKVPNWGESHVKQVKEYALANGFSEQEVNSIVDPRHVEVLYKAAQFDSLQQGKKAAVQKAQQAIKPKSRNPMPKEVGQKLNLRKKLKSSELSHSDKANLIAQDMGSRFFG